MKKSNKKTTGRIVIITGASQGIGLAAINLFRERGDTVYDISRTAGTDITDIIAVRTFIKKVHDEHGRIDVLINNAGFGISGSAEGTTPEDITKMLAVNFVGLANCVSAVLPHMRTATTSLRGGCVSEAPRREAPDEAIQTPPIIINISSVAGVYALPFQAFYSASKSAVTGYTSALRTEIKPFKIRCCAVLLGDIKTNFTQARQKNKTDDPAYYQAFKRAMHRYETDESKGYTPDFVAKRLYKLSHKKNPAPVVTFGALFKFLVFLGRIFPTRFMNWAIAKVYKQ